MAKRKPGKYDHLFPRLQKLPPEDLEYQQRVEEQKKTFRLCDSCNGTGASRSHVESATALKDIADAPPCSACKGSGRKTLSGAALAEYYIIARADVEELVRLMSAANLHLEAVSQLLIASQEQSESHPNEPSDWGAFGASPRGLKLSGGDALRVQPEIYPVAKDKNTFREWCYTNGLRSKMELPAKPMTDLAKARLLNGNTEPDGLTIYVRTKIVYTPFKMEGQITDSDDTSADAAF